MTLIFEGEEIYCHYHKGNSAYLLITFTTAGDTQDASRRYLMQDIAQRNGITCLGFTSSVRGFFLSPEMAAIEKKIRNIIALYKTVIIIGSSMGGYAAIKYSKMLGATHVLAFNPNYSVDPIELELDDEKKIYLRSGLIAHKIVRRESFKTMAPRAEDVQGKITVVYDPKEIIDEFSALMYAKKHPSFDLIGLRHIGHIAIDTYQSDVAMLKLINIIMENDQTRLLRFLTDSLRSNVKYILSVLHETARRKPRMALRAMNSQNAAIRAYIKDIEASYIANILLCRLYARKNYSLAYDVFRQRHLDRYSEKITVDDWSGPDGTPRYDTYLLFSELSTFLAYDIVAESLVFVHSTVDVPYQRPVIVRRNGNFLTFSFAKGQEVIGITLHGTGNATYSEVTLGDTSAIAVDFEGGARKCVRAYPDGKLDIVNYEIGSHEMFTLFPVPPKFMESGFTTGNWFEQAVMRNAIATPRGADLPRRSAIARLFRRPNASDMPHGRRRPIDVK
jgi:hypothetical protein